MTTQLFAAKDWDTVLAEALAVYRATAGVDLAPADPRRLHLHALLLFVWQQRALIDFAGRQSLLREVSEVWIDELAQFLDEERLPAEPATTTLRIEFTTPGPHYIAAGRRASGGGLLWAFDTFVDVAPGATSADVAATCTTPGVEGNGLAPGDIGEMADPVPFLDSVSNVTETSGGAPAETFEAFKARLRTAPAAWSIAGPREAYEALARRVSPSIVDVRAVATRDNAGLAGAPVDPGVARVLVLALGGAPSELLAAVEAALDDETVRPFTDDVDVTVPEPVELAIAGTYYIARSRAGEAVAIQADVAAAFAAYLSWQTGKIGRDINPDELRVRALAAGAKRLAFAPAFDFAALTLDQVAVLPVAVGPVLEEYPAYHVGDGTVLVALAAGGTPAPGSYRLTCVQAGAGGDPAVFNVYRYEPSAPLLLGQVEADGAAHELLGLEVTITEGATPFAYLVDRFTVEIGGVPALAYGGLEDD